MSMRKRVSISRRAPAEEAEIIVIPMIDVMMFLLFFFMVASLAMAVQSSLPVNLPKASTSNQSNQSQLVTITIMRDNTVFLNMGRTTIDQLEAGLKRLGVTDQNIVILNADEHVEHGLVVSAMDEARKAGVTHFAIATSK